MEPFLFVCIRSYAKRGCCSPPVLRQGWYLLVDEGDGRNSLMRSGCAGAGTTWNEQRDEILFSILVVSAGADCLVDFLFLNMLDWTGSRKEIFAAKQAEPRHLFQVTICIWFIIDQICIKNQRKIFEESQSAPKNTISHCKLTLIYVLVKLAKLSLSVAICYERINRVLLLYILLFWIILYNFCTQALVYCTGSHRRTSITAKCAWYLIFSVSNLS